MVRSIDTPLHKMCQNDVEIRAPNSRFSKIEKFREKLYFFFARRFFRLYFSFRRSNSICFEYLGMSCVNSQPGEPLVGIFTGHARAFSRFRKIEKFREKIDFFFARRFFRLYFSFCRSNSMCFEYVYVNCDQFQPG